jgi:uncharacterized membrane protein YciS (DUF1049 family)
MEIPAEVITTLFKEGLVLGLLGVAVTYFHKRCNKLEDKIDKYQEEDRKAMIDALHKNTKALEEFQSR